MTNGIIRGFRESRFGTVRAKTCDCHDPYVAMLCVTLRNGDSVELVTGESIPFKRHSNMFSSFPKALFPCHLFIFFPFL